MNDNLCEPAVMGKIVVRIQAPLAKRDGVADYPDPDLAIEVDISPSQLDRPEIYAKLQVAELWRFDGQTLTIEKLGDRGRYLPVEASQFLKIRADEVTPWLIDEDSSDKTAWARRLRLRAWVRAELLPRVGVSH